MNTYGIPYQIKLNHDIVKRVGNEVKGGKEKKKYSRKMNVL